MESKPSLDPSNFNISTFNTRLKKKDSWEDFFDSQQTLKPAIARLKRP
jgi:DNA primase